MTTPKTPRRTGTTGRARKRILRLPRLRRKRGLLFFGLIALTGPLLVLSGVLGYYYVSFSKMIDARIDGEMQRVDPRVFARPFELRRGQAITPHQLVERLNELGYANRAQPDTPGEFAVGRDTIVLIPRDGDRQGELVRVTFAARRSPEIEPSAITRVESEGSRRRTDGVTLAAPLVTALVPVGRAKRRDVPLAVIPPQMVQAVLAIEDRRFYDHPGIDPIAIAGVVSNAALGRGTLRGASTLTQQLVKNTFLTQERTLRRKMTEWMMSVVLERRLSKQQILELYLNDVWLGQRGSFAVHGVAEAARLFFAKDIANLTLAEAATIAGTIQSPPRYSPFNNPDKAKERRNVVLAEMAKAGFVTAEAAAAASREPITVSARALDAEAPYFVDYISQELQDRYKAKGAVDVYTTLDLHLQRLAQDSIREGLVKVDAVLAKRKRQRAQAALIAVDPRTGEILALVGGRSYNQSQFNRAINARRQPGSVFKPFVYLAAFEQALADGRTDTTPASLVLDEPTTITFNDQDWEPGNYDGEYDGPVTLRRALALSRNIPAIKVAEAAGYDHVAALWRKIGAGTPPRPYPSIALGVFEASPMEVASAYTLFTNGGSIRPLRAITRLVTAGRELPIAAAELREVAHVDTTYLVTSMMRSVIDEGTGAGARAAGFRLEAAGKSGTTNDMRDAWFVGFTPELLTVVWVGLDDNQPVGMTGTQAALPIWTSFMAKALNGHDSLAFAAPDDIVTAEIDRDTGQLATAGCPRTLDETFIQGTEPITYCRLHGFAALPATAIAGGEPAPAVR